MTRITALLTACGIATCVTLTACEKHDSHDDDGHSHAEGAEHAEGDGHDTDDNEHGEGGEHADGGGHDTDDHEHDEGGEHGDDDGHGGEPHALGTVEIGGATLAVASLGEFTPGSELHLNVSLASGGVPSAVRVWVGDETGVGAMKSMLEADGETMHGHVETSAELAEGARLWLEVEAADGTRSTGSVGLPG